MHPAHPAKEAKKPTSTSDYPDQLSDTTVALAAAKVYFAFLMKVSRKHLLACYCIARLLLGTSYA